MSRIAYIGLDRQVYLVGPEGEDPVQLTVPLPRGTGAWSMLNVPQDTYSWPTWSPDGEWLAAFNVEGGDNESGPVRVVTLSVDGLRVVEWAELRGISPIYLQWHPSGAGLCVLAQQGTELTLGLLRRDRLGQMRPLESGVPLFFNWTPSPAGGREGDGAERVLVHVGTRESPVGRLTLRDPMGDREDVLMDRPPGSFCAPVFVDGRAVYALRRTDGVSEVVSSEADGRDRRSLVSYKGLLAIVAAPPAGGPFVAVSHALRGEGTPYRGITLVHVHTGESRRLSEADCLSFFWSPSGDFLLYAVVDSTDNCLVWHRVMVADGLDTRLGSFWPTRDVLFYLHFFDQYAQSHPVVSPDGRYVVYAGYPAGNGQADLSSPPRIYVKDLADAEREPIEVGHGAFAVFSPRP